VKLPNSDVEVLNLLRLYVLTIEKKALEIWVNDQKKLCLEDMVDEFRTFLDKLTQMSQDCRSSAQAQGEPECRDGYEPCADGVCRVWCS
jgi:hypothetical protein